MVAFLNLLGSHTPLLTNNNAMFSHFYDKKNLTRVWLKKLFLVTMQSENINSDLRPTGNEKIPLFPYVGYV